MKKRKKRIISAEKRGKIKDQALNEIAFSRRYKQGKISHWQDNEDLYYAKKSTPSGSRANVDLARMQEFVHTLLSKIDNPLTFKFSKRKESQFAKVERLNALREYDKQVDNWDIKDLVGKKQGILYGRAIFSYFADSLNGYKAHLNNVDVYDFLIDPSGGGLDLDEALYLGRYNVIKSQKELKEGMNKGLYLRSEVEQLLQGQNAEENPQEEQNKLNRMFGQNTIGEKQTSTDQKYKFWEWFTTFEGDRYYLLMTDQGFVARIAYLVDMFSPTKHYPLGAWPFWTWAAFPDLTEFWTPSYADYVREIFQAQNVSINQMLDNAEAINKPQKIVNVNMIENLNDLRYRRDGIIRTKGTFDAQKAVQFVQTPSIETPIEVFNILESIQEKALGVTSGAKGVAEEEGKVGIYEGNQEAAADRYGLLNKSYTFGYHRFARLYEIGVKDHLIKPVAIDIIGPEGIESEDISRSDIFKEGDEFGVMVEASNAETLASIQAQRAKYLFLQGETANPLQNQKKAYELKAKVAGFDDEEIRELMDTSEFGQGKLMSECARDIEMIIEGKEIPLNENANNAYQQKIVDYMYDHREDMNEKQFMALVIYSEKLKPVIMRNTARMLNQFMIDQMEQGGIPAGLPQPNQIAETPTIQPIEQGGGSAVEKSINPLSSKVDIYGKEKKREISL